MNYMLVMLFQFLSNLMKTYRLQLGLLKLLLKDQFVQYTNNKLFSHLFRLRFS